MLLLAFSSAEAKSKKHCEPKLVCKPDFCCIDIEQLPYTITTPGRYCINHDLQWSGTGAAITIKDTHDVELTGNGYTLTVTNLNGIGVLGQDGKEYHVKNLNIVRPNGGLGKNRSLGNKSTLGVGQYAAQPLATYVRAINSILSIVSTDAGFVEISDSENVRVEDSSVENSAEAPGLVLKNTNKVTIINSTFAHNNINILLDGVDAASFNNDVTLASVVLQDSTGSTNLFVRQANRFTMIDSISELTELGGTSQSRNLAQFGDGTFDVANVTIESSHFSNGSLETDVEGLVFTAGFNFKLSDVTVDIANDSSNTNFAAIHLYGWRLGKIFNLTITGFPNNGIIGEHINNVTTNEIAIINSRIISKATKDPVLYPLNTNGVKFIGVSALNPARNNTIGGNQIIHFACGVLLGFCDSTHIINNDYADNNAPTCIDATNTNTFFYNNNPLP